MIGSSMGSNKSADNPARVAFSRRLHAGRLIRILKRTLLMPAL
jgi:hypothetical protein